MQLNYRFTQNSFVKDPEVLLRATSICLKKATVADDARLPRAFFLGLKKRNINLCFSDTNLLFYVMQTKNLGQAQQT